MGFFSNIWDDKLSLIVHFCHLIAFSFTIIGLAYLDSQIQKYCVLYFFASFFSLSISLFILLMKGLGKLTKMIRDIIYQFIIIVISLNLLGANDIFSNWCVNLGSNCKNSTKLYAFGASLNFFCLTALFLIDLFLNDARLKEYFSFR